LVLTSELPTLALEYGKTTKLKSFQMIKVTTQPHHMLPSLKKKDLSEMPLRIKLPETQRTQSLMPKDLLEENSLRNQFKKI
jgi:hypothetical protein